MAKRIVALFGEATFEIIEAEPERLKEVAGIGPSAPSRIVAGWAEQKAVREIMIFLHAHGVGTARAVRIFKTYGHEVDQGDDRGPVPAGSRHARHRLPHGGCDRGEARAWRRRHRSGCGPVSPSRSRPRWTRDIADCPTERARHARQKLLEVDADLIRVAIALK